MESSSNFSVKSSNNIKNLNKHEFGNISKFNIGSSNVEINYEHGYANLKFDDKIINLNFYTYKYQKRNFFNPNFKAEKIFKNNIYENENYTAIKWKDNIDVIIFNNGFIDIMNKNKLVCRFFDMAIINDQSLIVKINNNKNYHFYGLGQKLGFILNKNQARTSIWAKNNANSIEEVDQHLSLALNFHIVKVYNEYYGIFINNASKIQYDMMNEQYYTINCDLNNLNIFLMVGTNLQEILKQYFSLTGYPCLPPKYSFINHQAQNNYYSTTIINTMVNNFYYYHLPLTAIYLDILYMDKYQMFSFDNDNFKNIKLLINNLKNNNITLIPIIGPAISIKNELFLKANKIDIFVKNNDASLSTHLMWAGESAYIDYFNPKAQNWWVRQLSYYTKLGIKAFWCDMNEPTTFSKKQTLPLTAIHETISGKALHREVHNLYSYYQIKTTYNGLKQLLKNQRPFILTKSGYCGIQKYTAIWIEQNFSNWWNLKEIVMRALNFSLSGIIHFSVDIGNAIEDNALQLLIRWNQASILFPIFRNRYVNESKELYFHEQLYINIYQKILYFRSRLLPYLYTLAYLASKKAIPIVQPLFWFFEQDQNCYYIDNQYLVGKQIMVAPILEKDKNSRMVYFPEGQWIDYNTMKTYNSGYHLVELPLDSLPIFIAKGSIIVNCINEYDSAENYKQLHVNVYLDQYDFANSTPYYDDDGKTFNYQNHQYLYCEFIYSNGSVHIINKRGAYVPNYSIRVFIYRDELIRSYDLKWSE